MKETAVIQSRLPRSKPRPPALLRQQQRFYLKTLTDFSTITNLRSFSLARSGGASARARLCRQLDCDARVREPSDDYELLAESKVSCCPGRLAKFNFHYY